MAASLIAGVLAEIEHPAAVLVLLGGHGRSASGPGLLVAGRALFTFGQGVPDADVEADGGRRRLTDPGPDGSLRGRGVEQRQLVGLITRRSEVRIRPPQPATPPEPRSRPPGFYLFRPRVRPLLPAERPRARATTAPTPQIASSASEPAASGGAGDAPERDPQRVRRAARPAARAAIAASGAGRWSIGTTIPPSDEANARTGRSRRRASSRPGACPASSSPRPAKASVPSRTETTTRPDDAPAPAPASPARAPRPRRAARPGRPRRRGRPAIFAAISSGRG